MRSNPVLICLLLLAADLLAQPVIPPPSQSDEIIIDAGIPGSADPNDRIRYTVVIQNTGTDSATMVQLNAMIDPNTTLVPGLYVWVNQVQKPDSPPGYGKRMEGIVIRQGAIRIGPILGINIF